MQSVSVAIVGGDELILLPPLKPGVSLQFLKLPLLTLDAVLKLVIYLCYFGKTVGGAGCKLAVHPQLRWGHGAGRVYSLLGHLHSFDELQVERPYSCLLGRGLPGVDFLHTLLG